MKIYNMAILFVCMLFSSCASSSIKDNEIVVVKGSSKIQSSINAVSNKLDVEGINRFVNINYEKIPQEYEDYAVVTVSPDGSSVFLAERCDEQPRDDTMLIGNESARINLIRLDMETFETRVLCRNICFISMAKWNSKGTVVGFCGGEEIRIYDNANNKFMFEGETSNDSVTYFGWSPEGDRIYTEHPNIINGNIYYLDLNKVLYSYEAKENIYYRGILNDEYRYATSMATTGSLAYSMLIVNSSGNVVYKGDSGRFRDSYENQMAYIGSTGAGLYYYPDVNDMGVRNTLTNRFIYDAKFVYGGNIAYIESNSNLDKNDYILHIANREGKDIASMEVSGPVFTLSPDGAYGWIGGISWEKIDFRNNSLISSLKAGGGSIREDEALFSTIRSATNIWLRIHNMRSVTQSEIDDCFVNTNSPTQSAKLDIEQQYEAIKENIEIVGIEFDTELYLKSYKKYTSDGYERASAYINGTANNSSGLETSIDLSLELIKQSGIWYVTGFSTFPTEQDIDKVRLFIENYVKQIKEGVLLERMLKDADIQIGQLQFWSKNGENLATDIASAGYCKSYLTATQDGASKLYKLVLKKNSEGNWEVVLLTQESLSTLF